MQLIARGGLHSVPPLIQVSILTVSQVIFLSYDSHGSLQNSAQGAYEGAMGFVAERR